MAPRRQPRPVHHCEWHGDQARPRFNNARQPLLDHGVIRCVLPAGRATATRPDTHGGIRAGERLEGGC